MSITKFAHTMRGPIVRRAMNKPGAARTLTYTVVYLSNALERRLEFGHGSRLRIAGVVDTVPIRLALQPAPGANHYVLLSSKLCASIGKLVGDTVTLAFDVVDAADVVVPAELQSALDASADAKAVWSSLTAGTQRTWTYYVDRAKRPDTRMEKAREVVNRVRRGLTKPRDPWP